MLKPIRELQDPKYELVTDSQDVKFIHNYLGLTDYIYGCFLVEQKDGDFIEIWGLAGNCIPWLDFDVEKLK